MMNSNDSVLPNLNNCLTNNNIRSVFAGLHRYNDGRLFFHLFALSYRNEVVRHAIRSWSGS